MSRECEIIVTACEGREAITANTLLDLETIGGGDRCGARKTLHWTGMNTDHIRVPHGFALKWWKEGRGNSRQSFFRSIRTAHESNPRADIIIIEDDVFPAKNALPYVAMWEADYFTTFFNTRGWDYGLHAIDNAGFWGTQCIKIPQRLAGLFASEDPEKWLRNPSNHDVVMPGLHGADMILGYMLRAWKEPVFQHRSIFQHVGDVSLCAPGSKLTGIRVAKDFVDEIPLPGSGFGKFAQSESPRVVPVGNLNDVLESVPSRAFSTVTADQLLAMMSSAKSPTAKTIKFPPITLGPGETGTVTKQVTNTFKGNYLNVVQGSEFVIKSILIHHMEQLASPEDGVPASVFMGESFPLEMQVCPRQGRIDIVVTNDFGDAPAGFIAEISGAEFIE